MLYIEKWRIYSERSGNHIVSLCEDGTYACDCIGWRSHYPRKDCKHIREVLYTAPKPINLKSWDSLHGKKQKVKEALTKLENIRIQENRLCNS
jgi:hypothetical protein